MGNCDILTARLKIYGVLRILKRQKLVYIGFELDIQMILKHRDFLNNQADIALVELFFSTPSKNLNNRFRLSVGSNHIVAHIVDIAELFLALGLLVNRLLQLINHSFAIIAYAEDKFLEQPVKHIHADMVRGAAL